MERKYLLATLDVYTYNENKIKCDYYCIPVIPIEKDWKSEVSNDTLSSKDFKWTEVFKNKEVINDFNMVKFRKKDGHFTVSLIMYGDLEHDEQMALRKLYYLFNKHFWYKSKYRKFLDKKKSLGQINF